jgi:hypothetical protein
VTGRRKNLKEKDETKSPAAAAILVIGALLAFASVIGFRSWVQARRHAAEFAYDEPTRLTRVSYAAPEGRVGAATADVEGEVIAIETSRG